MTRPHSHRGEPLDEEHEAEREPHKPAHAAADYAQIEEPEEQPA